MPTFPSVELTQAGPGHSSSRRAWLLIVMLTAALTGISTFQSLRRYQELRSGWSWDLAYYNQWFWALTQGDGIVTVRPVSAYAQEGPSIWKMNYLAPIRMALVPLCWIAPDPRILIAIQNVMFWWVVPAAYSLARSESRSESVALSAAALVPLTPLFWPLVLNDFRELQLVGAFVLWAVQGVRSRSPGLSALGIAGMFACRQEFAVMVATFAFLPSREPESLSVTLRWRQGMLLVGLFWLLFGFFGYLSFMVGRGAPDAFIDQFFGPKASLIETLQTSFETLVLGMGAWALLACLAPRVALLALPWIWGLCSGRWAMRFLSSGDWHHVRYVVPTVIMILAAGLIGYARLATWLLSRPGGRLGLASVWTVAAVFCGVGLHDVSARLADVPVLIDQVESEQIWSWIRQVGPGDAVIADYEVSAPLSSRRQLYSYILDANLPNGFPQLGPEFHWLFIRNDYRFLKILLDQGFEVVHRGKYLTIARRGVATLARNSDFFDFARTRTLDKMSIVRNARRAPSLETNPDAFADADPIPSIRTCD
jgi:hypothetical protein